MTKLYASQPIQILQSEPLWSSVTTPENTILLKCPKTKSIQCIRLDGTQLWQTKVPHPIGIWGISAMLTIGPSGTAWTCGSDKLFELDTTTGEIIHSIEPKLNDKEHIAHVSVLDSELVIATYKEIGTNLSPRIIKMHYEGQEQWTTKLDIHVLPAEHETSVDLSSFDENRILRWRVNTWIPGTSHTPLVAGNLYAICYADSPSSGIGIWHGLSLNDGELRWTTSQAPYNCGAVVADDQILIDMQGYGAWGTALLHQGEQKAFWHTSGKIAVSPTGSVRIIELSNTTTVKNKQKGSSSIHGRIVRLEHGGKITKGESVAGFYTSEPVLTQDDQILFWHGDAIYTADANLKVHCLQKTSGHVLDLALTPDGHLIYREFSDTEHERSNKVYVMKTNLKPLTI